MANVYLDIDGVLLTKHPQKAAEGAIELIDYLTSNFDCYWLTTHCHDGSIFFLMKMMSTFFPTDILRKLEKIRPTHWDTLKTEAIDFSKEFYWLDDYAFEAEKKVLSQQKCLDNLIIVNLDNQNELHDVVLKLQNRRSLL